MINAIPQKINVRILVPKLAPKVGTVDKEVRYCYIALDKGFEPFHVKRDLGLTFDNKVIVV